MGDAPWEDYKSHSQSTTDGPWSDYKAPSEEEDTGLWHKKLPVLPGVAESIHSGADFLQSSAGKIAEEVGKVTGSTAAGAIAGAPSSLASTGAEFVAQSIPKDYGDLTVMAASEGVGRSLHAGLEFLSEPAVNRSLSDVQRKAVLAAQAINMPLKLSQLKQSKSWAMIETFLRKSPASTDMMAAKDAAQSNAVIAARKGVLDILGKPPIVEELGESTKEQISYRQGKVEEAREKIYENRRQQALNTPYRPSSKEVPDLPEKRGASLLSSGEAQRKVEFEESKRLYSWRDQVMPEKGTAISVTPLEDAIEKVKSEGGLRGEAFSKADQVLKNMAEPIYPSGWSSEKIEAIRAQVGGNPKLVAQLPPEVQKLLSMKPGGNKTFQDVDQLVRDFGDKQRAALEKGAFNEARRFGLLKDGAKASRDSYVESVGGEFKQRNAIADAFHGQYKDAHRNDLIAKLWDKGNNSRLILEGVVKSGNEKDVMSLVRALGPNGKEIVRRQVFDEIFSQSKLPPNTADLLERMNKYGPSMRALLTPSEQEAWKNFALAGKAPAFIETAYDRAMKQIISNEPHKIPDMILSNDPLLARAAKKYLKPETWTQYGQLLGENILNLKDASTPEEGLSGIKKNLDRYSDEYLRLFYPQKTIDRMRQVGDASQLLYGYGDLALKPVTGHDGAYMMGLTGMVINPGRAAKALGMIFLGSRVMSKMYTTEEGVKILTTLSRMAETDPRLPLLVKRMGTLGWIEHQAYQGAGVVPGISKRSISSPDESMKSIGGMKDIQPPVIQ